MDLSIIDSISWADLENAYGSAASAPQSLRALLSDDEDDVDEAIYGFLHSEACHQYTTYSCTPYVVKCVLYILELKEFKDSELGEILGFIQACTYNAREIESLRNEILSGIECYKKYKGRKARVGEEATKLVEFCNEY
ncbi:hypothetical protein [Aliikangiella maris]|uniref:Immunity protein 30 domain-containing protein n=2 Tax=Aliikangiella maris TaxID=3162458 RepID=A0ABV2BZZ2_9GAMM